MFEGKNFALIKANKLFAGTAQKLKIPISNKELLSAGAGDLIFKKDDEADAVYLIVSGEVKMEIPGIFKKPVVVTKSKNDFFGEKEFFEKTKRKGNAEAATDCQLCVLKKEKIDKLILLDKHIYFNLFGIDIDQADSSEGFAYTPADQQTASDEPEALIDLLLQDSDEESEISTGDALIDSEEFQIIEDPDTVTDTLDIEDIPAPEINQKENKRSFRDDSEKRVPAKRFDEDIPVDFDFLKELQKLDELKIEEGIPADENFSIDDDDFSIEDDILIGEEIPSNPAIIDEEKDLSNETSSAGDPEIDFTTEDDELTVDQLLKDDEISAEESTDDDLDLKEIDLDLKEMDLDQLPEKPVPFSDVEEDTVEDYFAEIPGSGDLPEEIKSEDVLGYVDTFNVSSEFELEPLELSAAEEEEFQDTFEAQKQEDEVSEILASGEIVQNEEDLLDSLINEPFDTEAVKAEDLKTKDLKDKDQKIKDTQIEDLKTKDSNKEQKPEDLKVKNPKTKDQKTKESKAKDQKTKEPKTKDQKTKEIKTQDIEIKEEKIEATLEESPGGLDIPVEEPGTLSGTGESIYYNELSEEVDEMTAAQFKLLLEAAQKINSSIKLDETLESILDAAKKLTGAEHGYLFLWDKDNNELWAKALNKEIDRETRLKIGEDIPGKSAEKNVIINLKNAYDDPGFNKERDKLEGTKTKSLLCVPIISKNGSVTAVLELTNSNKGEFTKSDEEALSALSLNISLALENAELIERQLQNDRLSSMGKMANFLIQDIKKPVLTIKYYAEHIKKKEVSSDVVQVLNMLIDQSNAVVDLVQTTLSYSEGKGILRAQPIRLSAALTDIFNLLAEYVESRHINLYKKFEADAVVNIDKREFYQACFQIVKNACDAMPSGGDIYVLVKIEHDVIKVEFKDTGHGIPESIKPRVFEPFMSYGKKQGVGLGLAIAEKIVKDHGGTITFESEDGEGTTFIISLPYISVV